jgi:hypothetical protein
MYQVSSCVDWIQAWINQSAGAMAGIRLQGITSDNASG